jgi:hypothetical protein
LFNVFALSEHQQRVNGRPVKCAKKVDHAGWEVARDDGVSRIEADLDLVGAALQELEAGQELRTQRQRDFFGAI